MFKDTLTNKKKLTYIAIAAVLIIVIAAGTVFALKVIGNTKETTKTPVVTTKQSADTLKTQAIEALKNNDKAKAKTALEEANSQYKELKDTNNVVDTNALLCLQGEKDYCTPAN